MNVPIRSVGPASVVGCLRERPCEQLLAYIEDLALSGTLVLHAELEATPLGALTFADGRIVRAYTAFPIYLSAILYEQGDIGASEVNATLRATANANAGTLFGDEAVRLGFVTRDAVDRAIVEQYLRKATSLFRLPPSTRYAYHHGVDAFHHYGRGDVRARACAAVIRGLRGAPPSAAQNLVLSRLTSSAPLELVTPSRTRARTCAEALTELELDEDERAVAEGCIEPRSMESLTKLHATKTVERVVYGLFLVRRIRAIGASVPGVTPRAGEPSFSFRPPVAHAPSGPRIRVAHEGGAAAPPSGVGEAVAELRRAKGLVRSRSFSQALRILESEIVRQSAPLSEVEALTAWARAQLEPARADEARETLTKVMERDPSYGHAAYLLGLLERAGGREARALRLFSRAVSADPSHIDAHRELRLHRLRQGR